MVIRTAIVHDYFSQFGGAERVALALAETFEADAIYTSIYHPAYTYDELQKFNIKTSYLQSLVPEGHFRLASPLLGRTFRSMDLSDYDRVIISSSGFAHQLKHPNAFVYCHTPPRFIYNLDDYFSSRLQMAATRPFLPWLRHNDQKGARQHGNYVANSIRTQQRIEQTYGKRVPVIHPPLRTAHLPTEPIRPSTEPRALVIARLQPYKRIDIAINACARANIPLTIVGTGIDELRLREMSHGEVTFLGRVSDAELPEIFSCHSMVLMPGIDDFGLAVVEANYAGLPVIARASGGVLETMQDGQTGLLVDSQDVDTWATAIKRCLETSWNPIALRELTTPFQLPAFQHAIRSWVSENSEKVLLKESPDAAEVLVDGHGRVVP